MSIIFNPMRLAAALLLIFTASHTLGGVLFPASNGAAADAVLAAMKTTHFDFHGSDCTYYDFKIGSGLMVSVFLILSAAIAWVLGEPRVAKNPVVKGALRPVAWSLFVAQVCNFVLSWKYFFSGPGFFSAVITFLIGSECVTVFRFR